MLTDLIDRLTGEMYHRILHWLGIDIEDFHEWLEGFCTCGHVGDAQDKEPTAS